MGGKQPNKPTIYWALSKLNGGDSPSYSILVRPPPGVLHPALESPIQEGHGVGPEEGHQDDQRARIPLL